MPAQRTDDEQTARDVRRLCYAGLDASTLRQAAVERLAQGLPFDAYCCFTADPMSQFVTHTIFGGAPQSDLDHFIEHVYFDDDINEFTWMARTQRPVALLSEGTRGDLERSLCYREILRPRGHAHEARSVFMVKRDLWGGIELSRDRRRADFDSREVALMARLAPHLGAGLKAAALRRLVRSDRSDDRAPGLLTLDQRQRIVNANAAALRWLRELGWSGSARHDAERLPQPVRVLLGALRKTLSPDTEADTARIPRLTVQMPAGQWLTLTADTAITQGDAPDVTMLLIEPIGPREATWLSRSSFDLTPREQEVAELVARGLSTRDIATTLSVTEYTVQDHLSHMFDKVGVRSRRSLVKRLFFDAMASGAIAPDERLCQ